MGLAKNEPATQCQQHAERNGGKHLEDMNHPHATYLPGKLHLQIFPAHAYESEWVVYYYRPLAFIFAYIHLLKEIY